jgi:hypothetical protein
MSNKEKTLNAIRLHLVLLNVATKAAQFRLEEIIRQQGNTVQNFLTTNATISNRNNSNRHLDAFYRTLDNLNQASYPNDLNPFDISACFCIAQLLNTSNTERRLFNELTRIRNTYYGHLNILEIDDVDYERVLNRLKFIIDAFSSNNTEFRLNNQNKIREIQAINNLTSEAQSKQILVTVVKEERETLLSIECLKDLTQNLLDKLDDSNIEFNNLYEMFKKLSTEAKKCSENEVELIAHRVSTRFEQQMINFTSKIFNKDDDSDEDLGQIFIDLNERINRNVNNELSNLTTMLSEKKEPLLEKLKTFKW